MKANINFWIPILILWIFNFICLIKEDKDFKSIKITAILENIIIIIFIICFILVFTC